MNNLNENNNEQWDSQQDLRYWFLARADSAEFKAYCELEQQVHEALFEQVQEVFEPFFHKLEKLINEQNLSVAICILKVLADCQSCFINSYIEQSLYEFPEVDVVWPANEAENVKRYYTDLHRQFGPVISAIVLDVAFLLYAQSALQETNPVGWSILFGHSTQMLSLRFGHEIYKCCGNLEPEEHQTLH